MERVKNVARHIVGADKAPRVRTVGTTDFFREHKVSPGAFIIDYLLRLFPILKWITRYNLAWLSGDLIAGEHGSPTLAEGQDTDKPSILGLTVGMILVPQR